MEQRGLRLIDNPVDRLARTIEALLVIGPAALSVEELALATEDETERVETALGLLASRYREGRSGIVLEQVAGGYAFRAAREAAEACARLVERPVQRGLSQAALETLAVVAYRQPVTRGQVSQIRGVNVDTVMKTLSARGLMPFSADNRIHVVPPCVVTEGEVSRALAIYDEGLTSVEAAH